MINNCSTDNSVKIVESYVGKFSGRLRLSHMEKNSGSGALPRNKGLTLSGGEYVFFVDADDLIITTALEKLYNVAKNFSADVVYTERFLVADQSLGKIAIESRQSGAFVDKPTLETDNLAERVQGILNFRYWVTPWSKFVKKDLLVENEISFPNVTVAEDDIWTYALIFHAKKLLRISEPVYIWRQNEESMLNKMKTPQETLHFWINPIIFGLNTLDKFMGQIEFFRRNTQYRCAVLKVFVYTKMSQTLNLNLSLSEIYEAINKEFGESLGQYAVLISWLLADSIVDKKIFYQTKNK